MAYKITVTYDRKTGEMISETVEKVDVVVNNRPLLELLYEKWIGGRIR